MRIELCSEGCSDSEDIFPIEKCGDNESEKRPEYDILDDHERMTVKDSFYLLI